VDAKAQQQEPQTELRIWQHCAVFLVACAVIVARRPDAIFHAQFYAEDGHVWFADAYNLGWWPALFRTWAGYFHALPRLTASLAQLVPLCLVPLFFNLIAIFFQALPVNLLLTSRSSVWGSLRFRTSLAGMYLMLPNCAEVSCGISNSNWLLALSALILLLAAAPQSETGRLFDIGFMLLCGLTGPYCFFLLPIAIFLAWRQRDSRSWLPAGILAVSCVIQAWPLLFVDRAARSHQAQTLGASPLMFARILGSQIYLGTLLGGNALSAQRGLWLSILLACVAIGGTVLVAICCLKSSMVMKLFLAFSALLLAGSLAVPVEWGHPAASVWALIAGLPGLRYWFFPTLAFAWSLLWGVQSRIGPIKAVSTALLCLMCFGILRDWRHPAFQETHFAESVRRFEAAPAGAVVIIPEHPEGWNLMLVKHPSRR